LDNDSPGVDVAELKESHDEPTGRYKLFTCELYRRVVLECLRQQLIADRNPRS
jgi:hypothetical protein